jgi:hypothetical protein
MHDYDRIQQELDSGDDELDGNQLEYVEPRYTEREALVFGESEELELAAELLGVTDEGELDQFLGKLIEGAGRAVGKFVKSPVARKLGGFLKGAAKKVLPIAGEALGSIVGGPLGGAIGGKLASAAGDIFGLELEGLSVEDQEFEVARRFVRFAGQAVKQASSAQEREEPHQAARQAVARAARRLAPGLLQAARAPESELDAKAPADAGRGGRWVRRGGSIVLLGV